ncbi:hypothetical protein AMATHDRAFT_136883 [Amanita thiersii Skay4041]|uniref:Thiamine phosphate synthase/TenI domain-containing protein n=1 Tax=Amanita thiersii Skay4041 TaxID=703135 RepID=A0A2A9NWE5_9AGAR|nr:hypothetical protein AMATHDRAFT_136883 [Amanita thiersii Skay4041]
MATTTPQIDYSLYLVTGRELVPPGKTYLESLKEALQGGVTVVQIREKNTETSEFLQIAQSSKLLCDEHHVPLIINDRIDIALATGAHGVHLGQTDMPVATARRLVPPGTVIGVSCNTVEQVRRAVSDGADYVGLGAVWATTTKKLTSPVVGVRGVGAMLEVLDGTRVKAVAIGGIKELNLLRTLHGSVSRTNHSLDGVAVVSEIMASQKPKEAAATLLSIFNAFNATLNNEPSPASVSMDSKILQGVLKLMEEVQRTAPLIHQITNTVVATQSANVTLALGASPIMANDADEMEDLAKIPGALLINIGTLGAASIPGMRKAGYYANANKKPIVFDPVGVGATALRKETVKELLNMFQVSIIKGNAGELAALADSTEVASKGVDSLGGFKDPITFVRELAKKERCVTVMTGETDYISDGDLVVVLKHGHPILGKITGSGCLVGSAIATYCAAATSLAGLSQHVDGQLVRGNMLLAAVAGVLVLTIATEEAVKGDKVKGPGSFLSGLIDVLWTLSSNDISQLARIEVHSPNQ